MSIIQQSERELYLCLLKLAEHHDSMHQWLACLPNWLRAIKNKERYAHAPYYESVVNKLPGAQPIFIDLDADCITAVIDFEQDAYKKATALLRNLMPWRKGGFLLGQGERQIHIDTEWRSDFKWRRIAPHIGNLSNQCVLDVGGGSGYHGLRMVGAGAQTVIVIDPSCLFYHQFLAVRHFLGDLRGRHGISPIHFIPVALEALPFDEAGGAFHTVFCMGVLYHRASPFECLIQLKQQLKKGGQLVLETLVVDGDETTVLVPRDRYAMMNNVYFLPSIAALSLWLEKAGFTDIRCVDVDVTSTDEQRATAWMNYQSLSDFLDPNDPNKTIEGYPRPKRAMLIAKR